jgi:hypothetical protein
MKHLPLAVAAGALLLAGSATAYAQGQPVVKEPEQSQGSKQQPPAKDQKGERPMSGERAQGGQDRQPEGRSNQDNQRSERNDGDASKVERDRASKDSPAQDGKKAEQQGGDGSKGDNQKRHAGKKLEAKQRTVVKETIVKRNVRPVKVNFSINVGAAIPRSVTLYDLPPVLIEYEPSYSRYKFIMTDDDTILVIDPETWTIVDVIEV